MHSLLHLLIISLLLASCSSGITVSTDYRPDFNFKAIKSYSYLAFDSAENITHSQSIYTARVETALNNSLNHKNLTLKPISPDVLIAYHIFTEKKEKQRVTTTSGGNIYYGRRYMGPSINMGITYIDNIEYNVGNMLIDVIDPKTQNVIWHGEASAKIDQAKNPEERSALIQEAVDTLLNDFPPQSLNQ